MNYTDPILWFWKVETFPPRNHRFSKSQHLKFKSQNQKRKRKKHLEELVVTNLAGFEVTDETSNPNFKTLANMKSCQIQAGHQERDLITQS